MSLWRRAGLGVAVVVLAFLSWHFVVPARSSTNKRPPAVVVDAAPAAKENVPDYLYALGNVQAFNTVTIRPQVGGQIVQVGFTEGQDVKSGDFLFQIDPRPFKNAVDQADAELAKDRASLTDAQLDLTRDQALAASNAVSHQVLDAQIALTKQDAALVQSDIAAEHTAQLNLDYSRITAPIAGRTGIRQVDIGNYVQIGGGTTGLVVLTQIQPISVVFTLTEDDFQAVSTAMQKGPLTVTAFSRDNTQALGTGTLLLIDNQIDQSTGTMRLKATFPNRNRLLWPGEFINVRLKLDEQHDQVTVPQAAIQRGPQGLYAYVVSHGGFVEQRTVATGQTVDGRTTVLHGIAPGEQVVTSGGDQIGAGTRVVINQPRRPALRQPARRRA